MCTRKVKRNTSTAQVQSNAFTLQQGDTGSTIGADSEFNHIDSAATPPLWRDENAVQVTKCERHKRKAEEGIKKHAPVESQQKKKGRGRSSPKPLKEMKQFRKAVSRIASSQMEGEAERR